MLDAIEKPGIDAGHLCNLFNWYAMPHSYCQCEHTFGRGPAQVPDDILARGLVAGKSFLGGYALKVEVEHADRLLEGFLKGAANTHHLAHGFHARADGLIHALEFLQVPARYFHH